MPPLMFSLLALLVTSTWMAALGWYVGLVHYPGFLQVSREDWAEFHSAHSFWTGLCVGPTMMVQAAATLLVCLHESTPTWAKGALVLTCLMSLGWTAIVSGPMHGRLAKGRDVEVIKRLIATNWPRALAWTIQAIFCMILISKH